MIPVGDRYIGNTRQQNDNLIAVLDAERLGDCCFELIEQFAAVALTEIEEGNGSLFGITDPIWLAQNRALGRAVYLLQRAIEAGDLRLWRIHDGREVQIVPLRLLNNDIRYGIFNTSYRPEPEMQGAWLWVKVTDWQSFLASIPMSAGTDVPDRRSQGGRPRILETVVEGLAKLYPDPTERMRVSPKLAMRQLETLGIRASVTTVKRAKTQGK